jgi:hypothetical protein
MQMSHKKIKLEVSTPVASTPVASPVLKEDAIFNHNLEKFSLTEKEVRDNIYDRITASIYSYEIKTYNCSMYRVRSQTVLLSINKFFFCFYRLTATFTTVLLSIKFFFCFYRLTAEIKKRQFGVATMWQKERKEMRLNAFAGFMSVVALAAVLEK